MQETKINFTGLEKGRETQRTQSETPWELPEAKTIEQSRGRNRRNLLQERNDNRLVVYYLFPGDVSSDLTISHHNLYSMDHIFIRQYVVFYHKLNIGI